MNPQHALGAPVAGRQLLPVQWQLRLARHTVVACPVAYLEPLPGGARLALAGRLPLARHRVPPALHHTHHRQLHWRQ